MATPDDNDALMLAYVYGELSESAAEAFEAELAADPGLRAEVDGLIATRDLLDADVRYGESAGLDQPPPHLTDAILRAESLARPPELREAAIQRASPPGESASLLHRLSTWLLGGGVALAAAAALFVVVTRGTLSEGAPADGLASAPAAEEAAAADSVIQAKDEAPAKEAELAPAPKSAGAQKAAGGGFVPDEAEAEPRQRGKAAMPSKAGPRGDLDAPGALYAGSERKAGPGEGSGRKRPARASELAEKDGEDRPSKSKTARARRSSKREASAGPPPLPEDLSRAEAQRRRLQKEAAKADKKGVRARQEKRRALGVQSEWEASDALATANRELQRGRPAAALDAYRMAQAADQGSKFGALPVVGQMKAYLELDKPDQVWVLFSQLRGRSLKEDAVVEGYRIAAKAAEELGRRDDAVELWRALRSVPSARKEARAELRRLTSRKVRSDAAQEQARPAGKK